LVIGRVAFVQEGKIFLMSRRQRNTSTNQRALDAIDSIIVVGGLQALAQILQGIPNARNRKRRKSAQVDRRTTPVRTLTSSGARKAVT
jgi:hypothetical protein